MTPFWITGIRHTPGFELQIVMRIAAAPQFSLSLTKAESKQLRQQLKAAERGMP